MNLSNLVSCRPNAHISPPTPHPPKQSRTERPVLNRVSGTFGTCVAISSWDVGTCEFSELQACTQLVVLHLYWNWRTNIYAYLQFWTYRKDKEHMTEQGPKNTLLKLKKTKKLVVNFKKKSGDHMPAFIGELMVEKLSCFKFLGLNFSGDLV